MSEAMTTPVESAPAPAPEASVSPQPPAPTPAPTEGGPAATMLGGEPPASAEVAPATPEAPAEAEAPIVYDLKLPETFQADPAALADLQSLAAEAKLPADQAQRLVDLHVKATESLVAQQLQAFQALQTQWTEEVNKLPDFATPTAREASLRTLASALDEFGTPEARSAFDMTGAGNNPHIVSLFLKMAKALSEGAPTSQGTPSTFKTPSQSLSERLYPQGN